MNSSRFKIGTFLDVIQGSNKLDEKQKAWILGQFTSHPTSEEMDDIYFTYIKPALIKAYEKHPINMPTLNDGIEVVHEEVDELIEVARSQNIDRIELIKEGTHAAAMMHRLFHDVLIPLSRYIKKQEEAEKNAATPAE